VGSPVGAVLGRKRKKKAKAHNQKEQPRLLKMTAPETLQWFGVSFVMHAVYGIVLGVVVARLSGTGGSKSILLVSHYDSVATAPGASDDSSGVATLLETARALKAGPGPDPVPPVHQRRPAWTRPGEPGHRE
jgi:acetylornithine deacetylase/succinyl-diaminopimelate desuccinylase-like protein